MKTAVTTFGRFNPPTKGHEKLIEKVHSFSSSGHADPFIFVSQSQDSKKNPLSYKDKIKFLKLLLPKFSKSIQLEQSVKHVIDVAKFLHKKEYNGLVFVVGSDRVNEIETLLKKYNGKEYDFETLKVVSAGDRDPDLPGVKGISASQMREYAMNGEKKKFVQNLPGGKPSEKLADQIYNSVRNGLGVFHESLNEDGNKRRYAMPQIDDNDKYLKWLEEVHDISSQRKVVSTAKLKPTQKEFNEDKIKSLMNSKQDWRDKEILICKDMHIFDGHHRWAAADRSEERKIKAHQIDENLDKVLEMTKEYKGAKYKKLSEAEMTPELKKKVEEIVKELKKKKSEFKDKYGDDWENVMYATATKKAKESLGINESHLSPFKEFLLKEKKQTEDDGSEKKKVKVGKEKQEIKLNPKDDEI